MPYQELARKLDEVDMVCGVGDCYGYQNIAFSLIGDVTYAVTGDFFYHQVEKRIFHPLGMNDATYGRDALESSKSWARPHYPPRQRLGAVRTQRKLLPCRRRPASTPASATWSNG